MAQSLPPTVEVGDTTGVGVVKPPVWVQRALIMTVSPSLPSISRGSQFQFACRISTLLNSFALSPLARSEPSPSVTDQRVPGDALWGEPYAVRVQAFFSGETKGNDDIGETHLTDTGLTSLYLGPDLAASGGPALFESFDPFGSPSLPAGVFVG